MQIFVSRFWTTGWSRDMFPARARSQIVDPSRAVLCVSTMESLDLTDSPNRTVTSSTRQDSPSHTRDRTRQAASLEHGATHTRE